MISLRRALSLLCEWGLELTGRWARADDRTFQNPMGCIKTQEKRVSSLLGLICIPISSPDLAPTLDPKAVQDDSNVGMIHELRSSRITRVEGMRWMFSVKS